MTELSVQTSSFTSHLLQEYSIYDNILLHNHALSADLSNLTDQQLDTDNGLTSHSLPLQPFSTMWDLPLVLCVLLRFPHMHGSEAV